jgi:hypothetical protein
VHCSDLLAHLLSVLTTPHPQVWQGNSFLNTKQMSSLLGPSHSSPFLLWQDGGNNPAVAQEGGSKMWSTCFPRLPRELKPHGSGQCPATDALLDDFPSSLFYSSKCPLFFHEISFQTDWPPLHICPSQAQLSGETLVRITHFSKWNMETFWNIQEDNQSDECHMEQRKRKRTSV